jgi:hypothetical protein
MDGTQGGPKAPPERALLILNRRAATGHRADALERIQAMLAEHLGPDLPLSSRNVDDHPAARAAARDFLAAAPTRALLIAGGGGGTLRAVIEGVCDGCEPGRLPDAHRVWLAALRCGSGNVLAKQFGMPRDPLEAARCIGIGTREGRTSPCGVTRCEVQAADGTTEVRHAATLGGFGQFGRVPGDLARWHARLPGLRRLAAWLFGIERLTDLEYALALLARSGACALWPRLAETVEVRHGDRGETLRLLAGALLRFRLRALPFDPPGSVADAAFSLHLIPYRGRWDAASLVLRPRAMAQSARVFLVAPDEELEIRLTDRASAEFFLDEDPMVITRRLVLKPAGTLTFVTGQAPSAAPGEAGRV